MDKINVINNRKESTFYRSIFECVKEVGVIEVLNFFEYVKKLEKQNLIEDAVLSGLHDTLSLTKKHKGVVKYLREHKEELSTIRLTNHYLIDLLNTLNGKSNDLVENYIENARALENLNIAIVKIVDSYSLLNNIFKCQVYRDKEGNITNIYKYVSDGLIKILSDEIVRDSVFRVSEIDFKIIKQMIDGKLKEPSFLIEEINTEQLTQYRKIWLTGFDFNPNFLPTLEDLSSYEIPKSLKLMK